MRYLLLFFITLIFLFFLAIVSAFNSNNKAGIKSPIQKRNQQIQDLIRTNFYIVA